MTEHRALGFDKRRNASMKPLNTPINRQASRP